MKKRVKILALGLLLTTAAQAQIFMTEDDQNSRMGTQTDLGVIPLNGSMDDQSNETYTPIGEGIILLSAFGGAYLLNKKKKK